MLNSRRLRSTAVALRREEAWYAALALLGHGRLHAGPIKLEDLKRTLSVVGRSGDLLIRRNCYDLAMIWSVVDETTAADSFELPIPHPGPDRPQGQWIWSAYSDAQLLQRTRSVFRSALEIYESIVAEWFPSFRDRLSTSVLLPAVVEGYLSPPQSSKEGLSGLPESRGAFELFRWGKLVELIFAWWRNPGVSIGQSRGLSLHGFAGYVLTLLSGCTIMRWTRWSEPPRVDSGGWLD